MFRVAAKALASFWTKAIHHEERLQFAVSSDVANSVGRYKAVLGRSAVSNNLPVKQPVRHPCLSLEEYLFEIPHPETEAHSRTDI